VRRQGRYRLTGWYATLQIVFRRPLATAAREIDPASLIIEPIADPTARLLGPEPNEP